MNVETLTNADTLVRTCRVLIGVFVRLDMSYQKNPVPTVCITALISTSALSVILVELMKSVKTPLGRLCAAANLGFIKRMMGTVRMLMSVLGLTLACRMASVWTLWGLSSVSVGLVIVT